MLRACAILGLALCMMPPHAWAQQPWPSPQLWPGIVQQQQPEEEGEFRSSPLLRIPTVGPALAPAYPGLSNYPLELLGLLMSPLERREVNLLPSIAVSEEFTDNIFLNNNNKRYDFVTSFTPALMLLVNRPRFQLAAGFSNSADLYARGSSPNDGHARQNFVGGVFYEPTPRLTFTASDTFTRDQSPDATSGGFSLGGQASWSNSLTPTVGWQVGSQTRLDLGAIYSVVRLEGEGAGIDSDT